jgi:serine/threonine protein kinase
VFALGVVMWETLTGRRLFLGRTDFETMQNVLERPIPPPSTLRPDIPTALDYIVVRALERDPARRYPDAKLLADELETVVQDLRYRSDAIPRMLESLFGPEQNSVQITPPHLPALDMNALGTWSSRSPTKDDRKRRSRGGPAAMGGTGLRRRRRRFALAATAATAAVLGLLAVLAGDFISATSADPGPSAMRVVEYSKR